MGFANIAKKCFASTKSFILQLSQNQNLPVSQPPPPPPKMDIANIAQKFFASTKACILQLSQKSNPPLSQPPLSPTINPETQENLQWHNIIMPFCFTSAIGIAVLSAQTQTQLPLSFHVLSFAILLTFASLFVAKFIGKNFFKMSQVLEKVSIFLAITALFFTIAIPFPVSLKCATWTVYAISWLTIAVCNYF